MLFRLVILLFVFTLFYSAQAQNDISFGGVGDGYGSVSFDSATNTMTSGGAGDGYVMQLCSNSNMTLSIGGVGDGYVTQTYFDTVISLSMGGAGDGYVKQLFTDSSATLSQGGVGDGYVRSETQADESSLTTGSVGDGYTYENFIFGQSSLTLGGSGDGYSFAPYVLMFWTGTVDSDWTKGDNWSLSRIPNQTDNLIIPSGRPNYPILPNGVLVIGQSFLNPEYKAGSIRVRSGALLTGQSSATIEVRSKLRIFGQMRWRNLSSGAWKNFPGSEVEVRNGGTLLLNQN